MDGLDYFLYFFLYGPGICLLAGLIIAVIIATLIARRPQPLTKSLQDKIKILFKIYYGSTGIIGITLVIEGIISLYIGERIGHIVFGAVQFILGILVILLSAVLLRRRYEEI
ncbi:MAG: hypothetical protein QMC80_04960 [Thermoplasmatales archaeon]|nr:hypothetical protein [Thermoplasmatales archaeon]